MSIGGTQPPTGCDALPQQWGDDDAILPAFRSAGQRGSAPRMLFLPHESADEITAGLNELVLGNPALPETDIGPVIDAAAGGPHTHYRFANKHAISINIMAQGGGPALLRL